MSPLPLIAEDSWLIRLITNHIGYFSLAIPIAILFLISKKTVHQKWPQPISRIIQSLIRIFISNTFSSSLSDVNNRDEISSPAEIASTTSNFTSHRFFKLIFSVFGLQISYLLWGLLQERIMTRTYDDEKFTNSQFLVFANRFLAMIVAYISFKIFYPMKKVVSAGPP
ncbi:unnamed protein product, partial [Rotaria sordida]